MGRTWVYVPVIDITLQSESLTRQKYKRRHRISTLLRMNMSITIFTMIRERETERDPEIKKDRVKGKKGQEKCESFL